MANDKIFFISATADTLLDIVATQYVHLQLLCSAFFHRKERKKTLKDVKRLLALMTY